MQARKKLIVLTGAGISAESGLKTFRDSDGLWEGHSIEDVATYDAWVRNPEFVQRFYNERRKLALEAEPNAGHLALKKLEERYDVHIITQNVDNLHEKAGSTNVLHLHGQLSQARSSKDPNLVYEIENWEIKMGDTCELGSQLRPNIVWFGEAVPMIEPAAMLAAEADIFVVVGTSLQVYPAAGLLNFAPKNIPIYVIDPKRPDANYPKNVTFIEEKATTGMEKLLTLI